MSTSCIEVTVIFKLGLEAVLTYHFLFPSEISQRAGHTGLNMLLALSVSCLLQPSTALRGWRARRYSHLTLTPPYHYQIWFTCGGLSSRAAHSVRHICLLYVPDKSIRESLWGNPLTDAISTGNSHSHLQGLLFTKWYPLKGQVRQTNKETIGQTGLDYNKECSYLSKWLQKMNILFRVMSL